MVMVFQLKYLYFIANSTAKTSNGRNDLFYFDYLQKQLPGRLKRVFLGGDALDKFQDCIISWGPCDIHQYPVHLSLVSNLC